jgi:hypothetical protein
MRISLGIGSQRLWRKSLMRGRGTMWTMVMIIQAARYLMVMVRIPLFGTSDKDVGDDEDPY